MPRRRKPAFPHVAAIRMDTPSYEWLWQSAGKNADQVAIAALARYAIQWARWLDDEIRAGRDIVELRNEARAMGSDLTFASFVAHRVEHTPDE